MNDSVYPFGPQKEPRLQSGGNGTASNVVCRGNTPDESTQEWVPTAIVPRFDVENGRDVGKLEPSYWAILEWNQETGEYRLTPLTEIVNWYGEDSE